jgi:hypothetical protein
MFRISTPETISQKVDTKQNGRGLKIKGFKIVSIAILF